jgi:hypothetical protein
MHSSSPPERIWIGSSFAKTCTFVLGESWYGEYKGDLVTDAGWIQAYLAGEVADGMYSKIANATGLSRSAFWESVMYTNFVQFVGSAATSRPTTAMYRDAQPRLSRILREHRPLRVWVLGTEQSAYSVPVISGEGITYEVAPHPRRPGVTNQQLGNSWATLQEGRAA